MNSTWIAVSLAPLAFACSSTGSASAPVETAHTATPASSHASPPQAALDTKRIEELTGLKGAMNTEENVFKVSSPRTDVPVMVDGRRLEPFMGLTSWAAFTPGKTAPCEVMGDLVLFQDEAMPVMNAALANGISVTALHNHFFFDEPKVYFMHISGDGAVDALARGVGAAFEAVKKQRAAKAQPASASTRDPVATKNDIPADKIEAILGAKGQSKDGMFKAVFGRTVHMTCGCDVGKEMGVNTWAGFAGDAERAIVDGDFATFEGELQPVLKALTHANIEVVAIHSHMEGETPKVIFLHYWGVGRAEDLARGVKAALDAQRK